MKRSVGRKSAALLLGALSAFILLEAGLRGFASAFSWLQESRNRASAAAGGTYRILCLGDSMTAGTYPKILEQLLNQNAEGRRFAVFDRARSGTNSRGVLANLERNLDELRPHMVVVMTGNNDASQYLAYGGLEAERSPRLKSLALIRILSRLIDDRRRAARIRSALEEVKLPAAPICSGHPASKDPAALAGCLLDHGRSSSAEAVLRGVLRRSPRDASAMLGLGELYLRVERYGKAESSFRRALAAAPRDTRGHAGLGKVLQARQELPLAEPAFKKALSLDPGNLDALAGLAACYERRGLGARSDELLMRIAAAHPRDAAALARLANEYCSRSRWAEADSALEKALLLDPGSFPARRALAVCRFTQGRPADAEDALAAGLRLCPQRLLLRFALAQLQLSQGRTHDAERMYRSVLRSDPGNPDAYTGLGECLELRGEFDEAQAAFERSVALDPGDYRRSACLGTLLIRRGELYSAFKAYRAALRLAPDSWQTYFLLGLAYSMKPVRNLRAAEGMFRKALASNPGAAGPRVKLAESLLRRRRYAEAESLLGRWVASSPEDPTLKALLSRCCSEQGKRELAQRYAGSARAQRRASRTAMTRQNCRLLRDAVLGRGIRLVCVQYPMRNPRPLEDLFDDKTGIVFVDNEKSFQEAVQRSGYWDYFIDMFGGDFGHCTPKGYRLLAQNIADAILRALGEGHTTGLPGQ